MDSKELALAVNFGKAPQELQEAVIGANDLYKQIEKLKANIKKDQELLAELEIQVGVQDKVVRKMLNAWDVSTAGEKV